MNQQQILPGVFYIPEAVSEVLAKTAFNWYFENQNLFYTPLYKGKYPMSLKMLCLGKHWSAIDNKYYDTRIDHDNLSVPPLPEWLQNFGQELIKKIYPHHKSELDLAVVNVYTTKSKLGMHQDNAESKESLRLGHPVISLSLGLPAEFVFRNGGDVKSIQLNHRDVLTFGDQNRLMYHGINSAASKPSILFDFRLNFTLRKY